jgi:hypothetical protein
MRPVIRVPAALLLSLPFAFPASPFLATANAAIDSCVAMHVTANAVANRAQANLQHFRISFQNRCEAQRVLYWCVEHASKPLYAAPICPRESGRQATTATPLYAIDRQREFQWVLPQGTRIRYVDCETAALPTSDLRCEPIPRPR